MNKFLLLAFLALVLACNKKDKSDPEPVINEKPGETPTDSVHFLKEVMVPGATKVVFDSLTRNILVTLPENYTNDGITINLNFYSGASLPYADQLPSPDKLEFFFENSAPLNFDVTNSSHVTRSFHVFVKHDGPLNASLEHVDMLRSLNGTFSIPVNFVSGIGTLPETPSAKDSLSVILGDEKTSNSVRGYYFSSRLVFPNVEPLIDAKSVFVKLEYGTKSIVLGKGLKFSQVKSIVYGIGDQFQLFKPIAVNKRLSINGQDFLPRKVYKVGIESNFLPLPVTVDATFESSSSLYFTIPANVPDGSYAVSVFENNDLVRRFPLVISSKDVKAIGQVWVTRNEYPVNSVSFQNTNEITAKKGGPLFVGQFPALLGGMYKPFDPKVKLPQLLLKNEAKQIVLAPKARADMSYADGSMPLYYAEYTIPTDLIPGFYEIRQIHPDNSETLPFWNKIEIK